VGGGYSFGEALTGLDMATPSAGGRPLNIAVIGEEAGISVYSTLDELALPGIGRTWSMIARNPGSGALMQFIQ